MKEGWMVKQGGFIKSWKRRYFKIIGTEIHYYSDEGKNEKGSLNLAYATDISVASKSECSHQPALKIRIEKPKLRIYYFQAKDESDRDSWISAFQEAMKNKDASNLPQTVSSGLITVDDFEFIKVLGRGSYGKVQLVKYKRDDKLYAMKYMKKKLILSTGLLDQSFAERDILVNVRHPFLVSAHFSFQNDDKIFLVLEYVNGGNLKNHFQESTRLNESEARFYAAQIALALGALHSKGYVYRDLKPENILIDKDGYIKITDFGLIKKNLTADPSGNSTFCGTPQYLAPEIIREERYSNSVDWWSFGIVLYELIAGKTPFFDSNISKMYHKILHSSPDFDDYFSYDAKDIITKLLDKNMDNEKNIRTRLGSENGFDEIKEHPFFNGLINWDDLLDKKIEPEWKPEINDKLDTSNFVDVCTSEAPGVSHPDFVDSPDSSQFSGFTSIEPLNF